MALMKYIDSNEKNLYFFQQEWSMKQWKGRIEAKIGFFHDLSILNSTFVDNNF
jgi:hypothetical protein